MSWDKKFDTILLRQTELSNAMSSGELSSDEFTTNAKEYGKVEALAEKIKQYKAVKLECEQASELLSDSDPEIVSMAKEELVHLKSQIPKIEQELKILMLPKDDADSRNVIVEIRAGAGGDEAGLFARSLLRMYVRFSERNNWTAEILNENLTELGGYNFVSLSISGKNVYSKLKFESGGHRVQRVPETESSGRVHTSAATVAVLPEAEDVDIQIDPSDLRIDTFRASGAGGQHVNTTDSAVRITHVPTGVVSQCQSGRSQHKNKDQAMKMLKTLMYDAKRQEAMQEISDSRKMQVGSGDRSQRIKTYNFPEKRVTDHRIGLTLYKLDKILDGDLDEMITAIITETQLKQLANFSA